MKYYKYDSVFSSTIFILSRKTSKVLFFRALKSNKEFIILGDKYEYFDLNNPIINTDVSQYRLLKRKCQMTPLKPHEIDLINNSVIYHHCEYYPVENHIINHYEFDPLENHFINQV